MQLTQLISTTKSCFRKFTSDYLVNQPKTNLVAFHILKSDKFLYIYGYPQKMMRIKVT